MSFRLAQGSSLPHSYLIGLVFQSPLLLLWNLKDKEVTNSLLDCCFECVITIQILISINLIAHNQAWIIWNGSPNSESQLRPLNSKIPGIKFVYRFLWWGRSSCQQTWSLILKHLSFQIELLNLWRKGQNNTHFGSRDINFNFLSILQKNNDSVKLMSHGINLAYIF